MKPRSTAEIRSLFLNFFASKEHAVIRGASLVPENDPTVLFTTAGMHPLVPYLLGEPHPAGKRVCDVQLCVRTGDIDEVGDASHLTLFEMLGNWSFGDYFKKEAIEMSYEFLTSEKYLGIEKEKLAVTCFEGDSDAPKDTESAEYWKAIGMPEERIGWLPKAKNWWGPAGQTGPCGPDTEMFYWVGEGTPPKGSNPANDEANWLEIWNDVFMQYNKNDDGTFTPLKQQNVDTGMGLERVAQVLQGVSSVYETDAFVALMEAVLPKGSIEMPKGSDLETMVMRHARIATDHIKAATFMAADSVEPSNVDQGYIMRRLIRRAIRSLRYLYVERVKDFDQTLYTSKIVSAVIDEYGSHYAVLQKKKDRILAVLEQEEKQFKKTLTEGAKQFEKIMEKSGDKIEGTDVFHLYDTYGFPIELTKELAEEQGKKIDEQGFTKAFEAHQALSRAGAEKKFSGGLADHSAETTKLHTATHLLNQALRTVLGNDVWQKGSNITAERLRFDFSYPEKMTPEQIKKVEDLVNEAINADEPISFTVMSVDEAKESGAIGVFDSKYGDSVKVYSMGAFSKEICGGPHVARTGMLGSFQIKKEEASSAGVRRIKATVSGGPLDIEMAEER